MEEKAVCRMVEVHKLLYFIPVKFNFIYNNAKPVSGNGREDKRPTEKEIQRLIVTNLVY